MSLDRSSTPRRCVSGARGCSRPAYQPRLVAKSYRLLPAILNTAVTEDELIIVNPCRIEGAGEERATERPALTLDQLYALVDLMPDRWKAFLPLKTFASLRWGEITALTRNDLDLERRTVCIRRQVSQGARRPPARTAEIEGRNQDGLVPGRHPARTPAPPGHLLSRWRWVGVCRAADEAIAAPLDARLSERESRPLPNAVGPVEGPTEPQLIAVEPDRSRKTAPDQG